MAQKGRLAEFNSLDVIHIYSEDTKHLSYVLFELFCVFMLVNILSHRDEGRDHEKTLESD